MKIQAKSLLSPKSGAAASKALPVEAVNTNPRPVELKTVANLQALASELRLFATEGTFSYPRNWVQIAGMSAIVLMGLALARLLMLVVLPLMQAVLLGIPISGALPSLWELAGLVVGMVLAFGMASILLDVFPSIRVTEQGLGISGLFGGRRVRWDQMGVLRVMELSGDRYLVLIPFTGDAGRSGTAPLLRLLPRIAGADSNSARGVMVTSHIKDFDRLIQLIVSNMSQAKGMSVPRIELFVDETAVMPMAQLLLDPEGAILRVARSNNSTDPYGMPADDVEPELNRRKVLTRQLLIALMPALLLLVYETTRDGANMLVYAGWALALLTFGMLELPFIAKLSQAVGDFTVGSGQFNRSILAYQELQAPRAALILLGVTLTGIGVPAAAAQVCWLVGIGLTTWLTIRFVQRVYYIPFSQTLWVAVGAFIYQIVLFALYFGIS